MLQISESWKDSSMQPSERVVLQDELLQAAETWEDSSMQLTEIVSAQPKLLQVAEPCKRFGPDFRRQLAELVGPQV